MTTGAIIRLLLQGLVFLVWAFLMFRMIFAARRNAEMETGKPFPGPFAFLKGLGIWLRSPEDRSERNLLGFFTFILFAMILSNALLAGG